MAGSVESSGTDVAASPSEPVTIAGAASSASPAGLKEISPLIVEAPLPGSGSDAAASLREAVAVAGAASSASASRFKEIAPLAAAPSLIAVAVLSTANEPKLNLASPQAARATVPHNATNAISCRGLIIRLLSTLDLRAGRAVGHITRAIVGPASFHAIKEKLPVTLFFEVVAQMQRVRGRQPIGGTPAR